MLLNKTLNLMIVKVTSYLEAGQLEKKIKYLENNIGDGENLKENFK